MIAFCGAPLGARSVTPILKRPHPSRHLTRGPHLPPSYTVYQHSRGGGILILTRITEDASAFRLFPTPGSVVRVMRLTPLPPDEPRKSIYVDEWHRAMLRLTVVDGAELHARLQALVDHIVGGWQHARALQQLVETHDRGGGTGFAHPLLEYIDDFVVDKFRTLAFRSLELIPPRGNCLSERIELEGDGELFHLMLVAVHLAADSPLLPQDLRASIRAATQPLLYWSPQYHFHLSQVYPPEHEAAKEDKPGTNTYN